MKLLLHMCCAPCSLYPIEVLKNENISFEGYFYNPNIHPIDEYTKRKENVLKASRHLNFTVSYDDEFLENDWANFSGAPSERCTMCYNKRIEKTSLYAKNNGFDSFTTTLLISPYQNHDQLVEISNFWSKKHGVKFYYMDFRKGFRSSQTQAKELEIYRQKYCGCIKSLPT